MTEPGTSDRPPAARAGMTARQARAVEWSIIALCILALALIFQPFWLPLYSVGAGLVGTAIIADAAYSSCYVKRWVDTPYGPRLRRIYICD